MGEWYWIGLAIGLGAGVGVLAAAILSPLRGGFAAAVVAGAAVGLAIGFAFWNWDEAVGGAVGGLAGSLGAAPVVRGTLTRGGTRVGTLLLLAAASAVVAALGLVPALGYLEAAVLPALGLRLRRRAGERYAGLRILARD